MKTTHKNGFSFCHGAVGVDDFELYLGTIGGVDLIYSAPPNASMISFWNQMSDKDGTSWRSMIDEFYEMVITLKPTEMYIESNEFTKELEEFLRSNFPGRIIETREIMYSAPTTKTGKGLCKRRIKTYVTCCNIDKSISDLDFSYSHELLGLVLGRADKLNCFDPFLGKGLLSRECVKNGHTCHGIEYNEERINSAIRYVEDYK